MKKKDCSGEEIMGGEDCKDPFIKRDKCKEYYMWMGKFYQCEERKLWCTESYDDVSEKDIENKKFKEKPTCDALEVDDRKECNTYYSSNKKKCMAIGNPSTCVQGQQCEKPVLFGHH